MPWKEKDGSFRAFRTISSCSSNSSLLASLSRSGAPKVSTSRVW